MGFFRKLFNSNKVRWVDNTQKRYPHLEADKYLHVYNSDEGDMFFTKHEVKEAKKLAKKNPEDL